MYLKFSIPISRSSRNTWWAIIWCLVERNKNVLKETSQKVDGPFSMNLAKPWMQKANIVVPTILLFFRDFFWRSGLLDNWIRPYARGHWFGCSLLPGTALNSPCHRLPGGWLHLSFRRQWLGIDPIDLGATTVVAPGLMLDNVLLVPIPDVPGA